MAKYWSKKSPEGPWDYIVIGSGMGGMTSAAMLAKLGKRVLVLEQHYVPGGFTHMFKRKGYEWDVGVHAVGEVTEHSKTGRLLAKLTEGQLKWASLGPVYDEFHYPEGFRIDFPDSPAQFRANLIEAFPNEVVAIDRYFQLVRDVVSGMQGYYLAKTAPMSLSKLGDRVLGKKAQTYLEMRTDKVMDEITDNEHLKTVLTAQWGYYGATPSESSFAIQALVSKHFMHGAYYPTGGSKQIANYLLKTVADAGGWTRINADVDRILVDGEKAIGVQLKGGEKLFANAVVSAAGIVSTINRLLPPEYLDRQMAQDSKGLKPAPAHICLYIGFKGDITQAGASAANKWFYKTWDRELETWDVSDPDNLTEAPILYCSFPSLKDPEHNPGAEVRHTGEVVTFVPWENFEPWIGTKWHKRGHSYDDMKVKLSEHILDQFLSCMPEELKPMVDYIELSTPLSTDHFCRPMSGSIYGIQPTPERFQNPWLRAQCPIKNLYFSGSEVATVGVIGAMMGGVLGAMAAEPVGVMKLMSKI